MVFLKYLPKNHSYSFYLTLGEITVLSTIFLANLILLLPFFGQPDQLNNFSAPLVPVLTTFTDWLVPYSYGVRIWIIASMLLFPITTYLFVKEITGRKLAGFLTAAILILPRGPFLIQRVESGLVGGDGAFVVSLVFLPLVCLTLLRFVRRGGFWSVLFASLGMTIVALTSPMGALTLLVFMTVIAFSEMLLGQGRLKFVRLLMVFVGAAGFSAFWYNPKFILLVLNSPQGQMIVGAFSNILPISFFVVPILGVFGFLIFDNRAHLQPLFIASFLTLAFGVLSWGSEATMIAVGATRFFVPLGISLAFLLGVLGLRVYDFLHHSPILDAPGLVRFRVITHKRELTSLSAACLMFIIPILGVGISLNSFQDYENQQVLGISDVQKSGFWQIQEQTSGIAGNLGYFITLSTIAGATVLKKQFSKR